MEVSYQLHSPAALIPRKGTPVALDKRLSGSQSQSERGGEEKKSGIEPRLSIL
jgi:hypothetical protein